MAPRHIVSYLSALALVGCISPPVEAPSTKVEQQTDVSTDQNVKDQVDLLFMVDDSPSMSAKQALLKARFPDLIKVLDDFAAAGHPADYHIGVVTSDLGATGFSGCSKSKGAKLQAIGAAADPGCKAPTGASYIQYNQKTNTNNLPAGQDLPTTFQCMASVGKEGCGLEHQLEATYRALHDNIPENSGFLRTGAILAVVYLTDEDDCSNDNPNSDIFSSPPTGPYGNLDSFRCTRFSILCDGMQLQTTPQTSYNNCVSWPASTPGGKLADVQKYINFFTLPLASGGVKASPRDVILAGITAPATPFGTELDSSGDGNCGSGANPCTVLSHSCHSSDNTYFGDPAVRIRQVIDAGANHADANICGDATEYKTALTAIGNKIVSALQPSCLTSPLGNPAAPDCVVEDVTATAGGNTTVGIPFCGDSGRGTMAAPCWRACNANDPTSAAKCQAATITGLSQCSTVCNPLDGKFQKVGIEIDRGAGGMAKPNTTADVHCATIAIANEDPNKACGAK